MKLLKKSVLLFLSLGLMVTMGVNLHANGLNLNGQGSKAIAMGGAFIGLADDASAVFWNPAGITQFKNPTFSFFATDLFPKATYKFSLAGVDAKSNNKMYPSGALSYYKPISEKLFLGIAAYIPSGLGSVWNGEDLKNLTGGVAYEWKSFVAVLSLSPVIAYKVNDQISFGATLNIDYGLMQLKNARLGQYKEDLNGFAFGGTFGALFKPFKQLSFGITFKTPMKVKLAGEAEMANAYFVGISTSSQATRRVTWPLWLGGGIAIKPIDKLTITLDAQFTNWQKMDTIPIEFSDVLWENARKGTYGALLKSAFDSSVVLNWKDKIQYRAGIEYKINNQWALRAGYYYDPTVSLDTYLNILIPQHSYRVITGGFGYSGNKIGLDFAFEYLQGRDRTAGLDAVMPGDYGMKILVPNLTFTYKF